MEPPVSDDVARARWMTINAMRIGGVAMVILGIAGLKGVIEFPEVAGYVLIAAGLVEIFVLPLVMARKWRSPLE
jgi:hypothetical protein